jgi:hypothetical protein
LLSLRPKAAFDDPAVIVVAGLTGDVEDIARADALRRQEGLVDIGGGMNTPQHGS